MAKRPRTTRTPRPVLKDLGGVRAHFAHLLEAGQHDALLDQLTALLGQLSEENLSLQERLFRALRQLYGRRGDTLDDASKQLLLAFLARQEGAPTSAEPDADPASGSPAAASESASDSTSPESSPKDSEGGPKGTGGQHGRRPLPAHLERRPVPVDVDPSQRACPIHHCERRVIDRVANEVLEYEPGCFFVQRFERLTRACPHCDDGDNVVRPPAVETVIERGLPGPALLAQVVVNKYVDHQPLERQSGQFARLGVELAPSTLLDWVSAAAELLAPIAGRITYFTFRAHVLSVDPTPVKVLDRAHENGVRRGAIWALLGDAAWVCFAYTKGTAHAVSLPLFETRAGYLQGDGYDGYAKWEASAKEPGTRVLLGCWAHCRRKFRDAEELGDTRAVVPLARIKQLYGLEQTWDDEGISTQERGVRRAVHSVPLVDALFEWAGKIRAQVSPKSRLGKALTYLENQARPLRAVLGDGAIRLDTNHVERTLRTVALGRRNWLFCGSDAGGERAAVLLTVLGMCRLHGVNPVAYLTDVFRRLTVGRGASDYDALLPQRWTEEKTEQNETLVSAGSLVA